MSGIKEFCRSFCPFGQKENGCTNIDLKLKCPVDYFVQWLLRK